MPDWDISGSQNLKRRSRDPGHAPFYLFLFFRLVSLTINLHTKFEVCIFSQYRDISRSQNLKSRSRDLATPFWPIFHFLVYYPLPSICMQSLRFVPSAVPEIIRGFCIFSHSRDIRGSQNLKSMSRDLGHSPFWPIFTALHVMQTRCCNENTVRPSVCLSVCLSVCHTRVLWQNGKKICPDLYTNEHLA